MAFIISSVLSQLTSKTYLLNHFREYAVKAASSSAMMGLGKGKKKGPITGKLGPASEKISLPVETDPDKLIRYVCGSNVNITGQDIEIKPDSEYPDWLWQLRTGPPPTLKEMDPDTKEYWMKVRKLGKRREMRLRKLRKF